MAVMRERRNVKRASKLDQRFLDSLALGKVSGAKRVFDEFPTMDGSPAALDQGASVMELNGKLRRHIGPEQPSEEPVAVCSGPVCAVDFAHETPPNCITYTQLIFN